MVRPSTEAIVSMRNVLDVHFLTLLPCLFRALMANNIADECSCCSEPVQCAHKSERKRNKKEPPSSYPQTSTESTWILSENKHNSNKSTHPFTMKTFFSTTAVLLTAVLSTVTAQTNSILDIATTTPSFSTLVTALGIAGLTDVFNCTTPPSCDDYTVFAPDNDAFGMLPDSVLTALTTNPEFETHLKNILLYHVVSGTVLSTDIVSGAMVPTLLTGETIDTTASAEGVFINDATVTLPNVVANNGVIHGINQVLLPPFMQNDIIGTAQAAGSFSTLLTALDAAGLTSALQEPGPFTVFAPTDEAFAQLPDGTLDSLLNDIPTLSSILTYHVIPDKITLTDDLVAGPVMTLQGEPIDVTINTYWVLSFPILNKNIEITGYDIFTSNGVIHVINEVLVPPSVATPHPTIIEIAAATPELSTLVAALGATGLDAALTDLTEPVTVFAPLNSAFESQIGADAIAELVANDTATLADILSYHVVPGAIIYDEFVDGPLTTLQGETIEVVLGRFRGVALLNGDVRVNSRDIQASDGVIHLIRDVLIPPSMVATPEPTPASTILDIAVGDPQFSTLVAAVQATNLTGALSGPGPLTVFAPTNAAFGAFLSAANLTAAEVLADTATLTSILLYHVVGGTIMSSDLADGAMVTTLQGENITVSEMMVTFMLNSRVGFVAVDIPALNGVVDVTGGSINNDNLINSPRRIMNRSDMM